MHFITRQAERATIMSAAATQPAQAAALNFHKHTICIEIKLYTSILQKGAPHHKNKSNYAFSLKPLSMVDFTFLLLHSNPN